MAPASTAAAVSAGLLASTICPGPSGCPASTSSLPVDTTTTRGRGRTSSRERPTAAARPICTAPRWVPAVRTVSPAATSSPARRTLAPAVGALRMTTVATPPSVHSSGMIESAPAGTIAPVMMRTQEPAETRSGDAGPAATSPVTGRTTGSCSVAVATSARRTA